MKAESPTNDTDAVLELMYRLGQAYLASGEQTENLLFEGRFLPED